MAKIDIRKILAPTDLSEHSQVGVRYALHLAKAIGAEVTVYHVVGYEELAQYGEQMTEKLATDYAFRPPDCILHRFQIALARFLNDNFSDLVPWVKVREKVEVGKAEENIVQRAKIEGSDLIVISTHGRTGLSHILMGSVTEKVVRNATCPVLSIHARPEEKTAQESVAVGQGPLL
jgi:nucleotide-binding universal stress UspA family protein